MRSMSSKDKTQKQFEHLKGLTNAAGRPLLDTGPEAHEEYKVAIRPDKSVSPAKFAPDPLRPGFFKAHPTTIKAMRKDIFVAGEEDLVDLEDWVVCQSCDEKLDRQFWFFCPYCESGVSFK